MFTRAGTSTSLPPKQLGWARRGLAICALSIWLALGWAPSLVIANDEVTDGSAAAPGLPEAAVSRADIQVLWHSDVLSAMKLKVARKGEPGQREAHYLEVFGRDTRIRAVPGRFDQFLGEYLWPSEWTFTHPDRELTIGDLTLHARAGLGFELRNSTGQTWLTIGAGHPRMDSERRRVLLSGAELRVGPALARWLGSIALADQPLAMINAQFQLMPQRFALMAPAQALGCPVPPRWPGTPIDPGNPGLGNYQADVYLLSISTLKFLRCRQLAMPTQSCDGPGASEGEVALAPDALLRNSNKANSADVPWYPKFLGILPPYDNDQHPYLVWNLYRADADGYLLQIGRSGLKHAFVTINNGCVLGCSPPPPANANQVLYPNCSDVYAAGTNDTAQFLGPRAELIPATGLWGRCGSVFDLDCDGVEDTPGSLDYDHRLVVRETALDPAAHPDAEYYQDAWYVVRDDIDIDNTMGSRAVLPIFAAGSWNFQFTDTELVNGPMVTRWALLPLAEGQRSLSRLRTAEGEIALSARVEQVSPGQWRYRYVLANLDYARVSTSGTAPNLRVDSEHGLAGLIVPLLRSASASTLGFRDGDPLPGNDWIPVLTANHVRWPAPDAAAELRWGNLISYGFDSTTPPGYADAAVELAGSPGPANLSLRTLVPGGELFGDGFE